MNWGGGWGEVIMEIPFVRHSYVCKMVYSIYL